MEHLSFQKLLINGQEIDIPYNEYIDRINAIIDIINGLSATATTLTATTVNATTFDTNVAAAGATIVGTTIATDGTDANIPITITPKASNIRSVAGTALLPTYSFTSDPDTGIFSSTANALGIATGGTEHWTVNSSGALNPVTDNTKDIGNLSSNPRDITASRSFVKKGIVSTGGYGQLAIKSISASKTLTNAQTNTLAIQIPSGAMLIGVQLRNDTAIAGVDDATGLVPITTYSTIYATGATQTINSSIAIAINTKTNKFFNTNAATNILSAATDITLDAGTGNKFTAGGIISAVAYYYDLTSITDL